MMPSPQPAHTTAPTSSAGSRRALAWASFLLSLVFPLTYLFVVAIVVVQSRAPSGANPFVVSLYTVFDYFEWPFPILAVILGHSALATSRPRQRVAWAGLALGYLSIVALLGIVIALSVAPIP